ncbi:DUF1461 domain-containing protein, partial [Candidatus Woesearchaeota archaeon]|nr:DUF1461 domain-containing protein [Candidatus Woesearchaeota archaeon]
MLVVCAIIPFNSVFTAMHHILFPQGNWQFPADSMLIQYYPSGFWNEYYLIAGFIIVMLAVLFMLAGWLLRKLYFLKCKSLKNS